MEWSAGRDQRHFKCRHSWLFNSAQRQQSGGERDKKWVSIAPESFLPKPGWSCKLLLRRSGLAWLQKCVSAQRRTQDMLGTMVDYLTKCFTYIKQKKKKETDCSRKVWTQSDVGSIWCSVWQKTEQDSMYEIQRTVGIISNPNWGCSRQWTSYRSVALQQEPTENDTHQRWTVWLYINPSFQARLYKPSHLLQ